MWQRHATDAVSLVFGTIFAGVTAVWLLNVADVIDLESAWLAGPAILIVAGVVGLAAALRPSRDRPRTPPAWEHPADPATAPSYEGSTAAGVDWSGASSSPVASDDSAKVGHDDAVEAPDEPVKATTIDAEGADAVDPDTQRRD